MKTEQKLALADLEGQVRHEEFKEFEKWQDDFKEECGCQVIILNSPVGESAANGKVENAIQRIQDQIRSIKLDLEINANIKIFPESPSVAVDNRICCTDIVVLAYQR